MEKAKLFEDIDQDLVSILSTCFLNDAVTINMSSYSFRPVMAFVMMKGLRMK